MNRTATDSFTIACLALVLAVLSGSKTQAAFVEVNSGVYAGAGELGAPGTGRAQGIQALETFTISSVGIEADLSVQQYDVVIHASTTGSDPLGVLATTTEVVGGDGFVFHDIAIDFTFQAGDFYVVNWRPTLESISWINNNDLAYYEDAALPTDAPPFRLVDGLAGFSPVSGNSLHPNMRYFVVPEPAAATLSGAFLACAGVRRRCRSL